MTLPQLPSPCRLLRTKTYFSHYTQENGEERDWSTGESTTAAYWCLNTMAPVGPDEDFAYPTRCVDGRVCFKAPLE